MTDEVASLQAKARRTMAEAQHSSRVTSTRGASPGPTTPCFMLPRRPSRRPARTGHERIREAAVRREDRDASLVMRIKS